MNREHEPLILMRSLSAGYVPEQPVLSGLSMELFPHEAIGLIGLNGAGKTTLIRTMAGLLPSHTDQLLWNSRSFSFRDPSFRSHRYIVFAEDRSFSCFTFREYLAYAAASYGMPVPDITELIRGFRFETYADVLLKNLSTGNRKKASLITAFALQPELLLMDEPVNGLDFESTEYLYRKIREYALHGTVLFSSHILESIALTADRVLVLEQGKITRTFCKSEIRSDSIRKVLYDQNVR